MNLTKDFSQCQDCVFYINGDGKELCCCTGDKLLLDVKEENCPDHITTEEVAMNMKRRKEATERQKKEEQERLEREKREKEEYERTHPKEFWTLFYLENYPLCYEITSHYEENGSPYPVDNNRSHWTGENNEDAVYYFSTEEKAYQKYKEVLEEYIKDAEAELLKMRERLTYLKAQGRIK